jgi:hypothetical protein
MSILIEDLSLYSNECGLTKEGIRNAIMFPLSSTGIKVGVDEPAVFYVNIGTLYFSSPRGCVSSIRVEVRTYQYVTLKFSIENKFVKIDLWGGDAIFSTDRDGHARNVSDKLDELTKKFVTDWNYDNEPR